MAKNPKYVSIQHRWLRRNLLIIGPAILAGFLLAAIVLSSYTRENMLNAMEMRASTTAVYINRYMSNTYDQFYSYGFQAAENFEDRDKLELQVLDNQGRVMFCSNGLTDGFTQSTADVHAALYESRVGRYIGWDPVTGSRVAAVTAPVYSISGETVGGIRVLSSTELLFRETARLFVVLVACGLALILLVVMLNQIFLDGIIRPVLQVNTAAAEIAGGNYGQRVPVTSEDEIGQLCRTINYMSVELQRADAEKNEFISSVSHELRTPLTAIGGWAEAVASDPADQDNARTGLDIIIKESRRLGQMVNELLDFSRLESGGLKLQNETFDLGAELYDALLTYDDLLRSNRMQLKHTEPEEPVLVYGDCDRIRQVFLNIIDNACKYGSEGEKLDVSLSLENNMAVVRFRDYGVGIPQDELPMVKNKFYKGSAKGKGTGIGLALCDEIVAMHKGRFEIDSTYGEGTTVVVRLPLLNKENQK